MPNGNNSSKKENKRSISLRMNSADLTKVRSIATRLRVRESDVFRFAIKMALARLSPLHDKNIKGTELMPVFVDCGTDMALHFNLDSDRLNDVINGDLEHDESRVCEDDIELMSMAIMPERYLKLKLKELVGQPVERLGVNESLRLYLSDKYLEPTLTEAGDEQQS